MKDKVYRMKSETPETIIESIIKMGQNMKRPIYRGVGRAHIPDSSEYLEYHPLRAGAVQRLLNDANSEEKKKELLGDDDRLWKEIQDYHEEHLIKPMSKIFERPLSDLQKLSLLQHQGAATGFLDFTRNYHVALWFACHEECHHDKDGEIFVFDVFDDRYFKDGRNQEKVFGEAEDEAEDEAEGRKAVEDGSIYYEPDYWVSSRIVAQQSVFVIFNKDMSISHKYLKPVRISKDIKEHCLKFLNDRHGLSYEYLFPDVEGLAKKHRREDPWPLCSQ